VITQIENAAALAAIQAAPLSPGLIFAVKGTRLGPGVNAAPLIDPDTGLIANNVSGVQVLVDGTPAPLLYISPAQINAVRALRVAQPDRRNRARAGDLQRNPGQPEGRDDPADGAGHLFV